MHLADLKFITPDYPEPIKLYGESALFLAGPIQGTYNWQEEARVYLRSFGYTGYIFSPRGTLKPEGFDYAHQVDWEGEWLEQSSKSAGILFWLAKEKTHDPKRAYAQTTRFELGEWLAYKLFNRKIKISLGIEEGFTGERYIRHRVNQDMEIYNNLPDTCAGILL